MKRLVVISLLVLSLLFAHVSEVQGKAAFAETYISGVSGHAQGYSLSCEARSAVDLAGFWGISIGETEFLEALPRSDNPDEGFVGDPNEAWGSIPPHGYGVHADPVAGTLEQFGLAAEAHHDLSWDDLREEVDNGRPVIVWVIGQMWGGKPVQYEAPDGSTSVVAAYEHTMILVGYSQDAVQVVDAYSGQYQTYWRSTFLKSWAVLGSMAVFAWLDEPADDEPAPESHGDTYVVQPGDYLVALAERFGTTWQVLAQLSSIGYPYTIFPGQVLQLPASEPSQPEPAETPEASQAADFQLSLPVIQRNASVEAVLPHRHSWYPPHVSKR